MLAAIMVGVALASEDAHAEDRRSSGPIVDGAPATVERAERVRLPTEHPPWSELGSFEREMADLVLRTLARRPATPEEGTSVGEVIVVRMPFVIEADVPPMWLNRLRALSREEVVRAGIALESGDVWSDTLWRDSRRALLDPALFSTVMVLPVESDDVDGDRVDVLVVVRDVWSLRLNVFPSAAGALTNVHVSAVDSNVLGTNATLGLVFDLRPGDWMLGPVYSTERFARTRIAVREQLRFQSQRPGGLEGLRQELSVGRPLYDTTSSRGWQGTVSWSNVAERRFEGDRLRRFTSPTEPEVGVDEVWRERSLVSEVGGIFAWGQENRWRVEPIFALEWRRSSPSDEVLERDPAFQRAFADRVMLPNRRDVGPGVRVGWETNRFFSQTEVETFRVAEELRDGGAAEVTLRAWEPGLGARVRGISAAAELGWLHRLGADSHVRWALGSTSRWEQERGWVDQYFDGKVRGVTPSLLWGRWVVEVRGRVFVENDAFVRELLGADTGQRGYAAGSFSATDHAAWNVEWRSRSLEVLRTWWGGAVFWDGLWLPPGGEAEEGLYGTVGVGVRVAAPQGGTVVRGLDLGFPLRDGVGLRARGAWSRVPRPILSIRLGQGF